MKTFKVGDRVKNLTTGAVGEVIRNEMYERVYLVPVKWGSGQVSGIPINNVRKLDDLESFSPAFPGAEWDA